MITLFVWIDSWKYLTVWADVRETTPLALTAEVTVGTDDVCPELARFWIKLADGTGKRFIQSASRVSVLWTWNKFALLYRSLSVFEVDWDFV